MSKKIDIKIITRKEKKGGGGLCRDKPIFHEYIIVAAIWMLPMWEEYGGWPASGEIDLVESRGKMM